MRLYIPPRAQKMFRWAAREGMCFDTAPRFTRPFRASIHPSTSATNRPGAPRASVEGSVSLSHTAIVGPVCVE